MKKFVVRYLDNIGVEHTEEIEDDIAFYQRVRQEGLSVISIHKIKRSSEESSEPLLLPRLRQRMKERRERRKHREASTISTETRDITDLVRSQFDFTCPICEDIAEKVSAKFPDKVTRTQVYEAVYKLSSQDRKIQDEGMISLEKLGILQSVLTEVEGKWEKLKEGEA